MNTFFPQGSKPKIAFPKRFQYCPGSVICITAKKTEWVAVVIETCHCFFTCTDQDDEDHSHSMPIVPAILVPACAVLLLLITSGTITILYVRRRWRQSVAVNSMEKVEMESTNTVETERGLVNIRAYILCLYM